jgi:hypothetical protein
MALAVAVAGTKPIKIAKNNPLHPFFERTPAPITTETARFNNP